MTFGGWITFIASTGAFTLLFAWCIYKVISAKKPVDEKMIGFPEINSEMDSEIDKDTKK